MKTGMDVKVYFLSVFMIILRCMAWIESVPCMAGTFSGTMRRGKGRKCAWCHVLGGGAVINSSLSHGSNMGESPVLPQLKPAM